MKGKGTGGNFQMPYRQDQRQGKDKQNMSNLQIRQHRFSIRENRKGSVHNRMLTIKIFIPILQEHKSKLLWKGYHRYR